MMDKTQIEQLVKYEDGKLYWRESRGSRAAGDEVGHVHKSTGYRVTKIDGKFWAVHRLVWLIHHNKLPKTLDHVNGDKLDNRVENLRPCTQAENTFNRAKNKKKHWPKGVQYIAKGDGFVGFVGFRRKRHYAGFHKTAAEAEAAVKELRERLHREFARH